MRVTVASILLLLTAEVVPVGTALLLPLENRFQPWDPSRGAPTGIIVLGGVINPEVSKQRGEISLNEAAERLVAALELYQRYPTVRVVFSGGNSDTLFLADPNLNLQPYFYSDSVFRGTASSSRLAHVIRWRMPSTRRGL
jgi:hypothetical protein